jgi:hypothetical protein
MIHTYLHYADRRDLTPDFLIRIFIKRLPSSQTGPKRQTYTVVPDGLQHPKFKGLDSYRGYYIVCRRAALQEFDKRGTAPFYYSQHKAALKKKYYYFSRVLSSSRVRRDQDVLLIAGLYQSLAALAYSARTGTLG